MSVSHGPPTWNTAGLDGQVAPAGQHVADLDLAGPAEDDAQRAGVGVVEDVDDRAGERGVGERRHGHQQRAGPDVVERADARAPATARARRRPVAGRAGGPDSGSGDAGTGVIATQCAPARRRRRSGAAWRNRRAAVPSAAPVARDGAAGADGVRPPAASAATSAGCCATRLFSQFGDGVFQAALAGTVLFNPQRAADPIDVAAGFAVLLLPYSLVGPFAGVWLDRWSRRQVLLRANVAARRAGGRRGRADPRRRRGRRPSTSPGWPVFSVNRFVLAALSAALPHTTDEPSLVSANALSTTAGAVATVVGGGAALAAAAADRHGQRRVRRRWRWPRRCPTSPPRLWSPGSPGPTWAPTPSAAPARLRGAADVAAGHGGRRPARLGAPARGRGAGRDRPAPALLRRPHADDAAALPQHASPTAAASSPAAWLGLGEVVAAGAVGHAAGRGGHPAVVRRIGPGRGGSPCCSSLGAVAQLALGLLFIAAAVVAGRPAAGVRRRRA